MINGITAGDWKAYAFHAVNRIFSKLQEQRKSLWKAR